MDVQGQSAGHRLPRGRCSLSARPAASIGCGSAGRGAASCCDPRTARCRHDAVRDGRPLRRVDRTSRTTASSAGRRRGLAPIARHIRGLGRRGGPCYPETSSSLFTCTARRYSRMCIRASDTAPMPRLIRVSERSPSLEVQGICAYSRAFCHRGRSGLSAGFFPDWRRCCGLNEPAAQATTSESVPPISTNRKEESPMRNAPGGEPHPATLAT